MVGLGRTVIATVALQLALVPQPLVHFDLYVVVEVRPLTTKSPTELTVPELPAELVHDQFTVPSQVDEVKVIVSPEPEQIEVALAMIL
jgi:hypothetical protein